MPALPPVPAFLLTHPTIFRKASFRLTATPSLRPTLQPPSLLHLRRPVATLAEDFLTGPASPPFPRPLTKVITFSSLTGLLWYGYYKFCVEEELRKYLGSGPGGYLALGPFTAGILSPLFLPTGGPAETGVALGVLWIMAVQYSLYGRINRVCEEKGLGTPLTPAWLVVPGFNLVVGLRSIHFLSLAWGARKEDDPVVKVFPCLGVETLGFWELLTNPKLWVKLF